MDDPVLAASQPDSGSPNALDDDALTYLRGMERLMEAVLDLASARSLEQIADIVRHAARDLSRADGATFVLRDQGNCYYMDEDAIEPLWRGLRFPMETCISGWAMLHKEGVAIADIYLDDRIPHDAYRPTFVKSLTISPIRTADPIGAIGSYWATHHDATHTERRLLQALADSTAVALESVRILTDLETLVAERTGQLATANDDLHQFAARAAHDLREPLTTMTGFARLLSKELGPAGGQSAQAADAIERTGQRMVTLIDELLAFASAGSRERETELVDLDALIEEILSELAQRIDDSGAEVTVRSLGTVQADRLLLGQALQNLVSNAVNYVREGVVPQVLIEVEGSDNTVAIRVIDNGPGVAPEERERIRRPFARGDAAEGVPGTGLGLAICQRVAEHHNGELLIDDVPGGGSIFALRLPDTAEPERVDRS